MGHAEEIGFPGEVIERGTRAVEDLPAGLVYAGFSLGVLPAQKLAQSRPGARGALLFYSCVPVSVFGSWPEGVPVQVHGMDADPIFAGRGRPRRRPRAHQPGQGRGTVSLPRRPALLRRQHAALLRPGRHRAAAPAGARLPPGPLAGPLGYGDGAAHQPGHPRRRRRKPRPDVLRTARLAGPGNRRDSVLPGRGHGAGPVGTGQARRRLRRRGHRSRCCRPGAERPVAGPRSTRPWPRRPRPEPR